MEKFVALFDLHWGYARQGGHKVPLHDQRALDVALQFVSDFKPHHTILGGDILDCGAISHHNDGKPGEVEGLRIRQDAQEARKELILPVESYTKDRLVYHIGNHEDWLQDLVMRCPPLEGLVEAEHILSLGKRWEVVEVGGISRLGKLHFVHGEHVKTQNLAKAAVETYERNIRFGHHHTYQVYTKTSPVESNGHTGVAVPCLCRKDPTYGKQAPNKWKQGFLYGYVDCPDNTFNDYVAVIVNGKVTIGGKTYRG